MNYAIQVENLTKKFNNDIIVNHISLRIPYGKIYGFLGPNGSGKTTSIRMLCGLLTPDEGTGTCLGYNLLNDSEKIRSKTGYMTQKFSFWEDLTIKENLEFVANVFGMDNICDRVHKTLKNFGLSSEKNMLAGTLSGGWKQRLALAACVIHEPLLLLLDEPTAGVDPKARKEFWEEIRRLSRQGITVLVSTHYLDEAERCDKIVYIAYGNIIIEGTVNEVIKGSGFSSLEDSFIFYMNKAQQNKLS
jgi:ABC-2 type transport system ATP-binding protein